MLRFDDILRGIERGSPWLCLTDFRSCLFCCWLFFSCCQRETNDRLKKQTEAPCEVRVILFWNRIRTKGFRWELGALAKHCPELMGTTTLVLDWQMSTTSWLHHQSKVYTDVIGSFVFVGFGHCLVNWLLICKIKYRNKKHWKKSFQRSADLLNPQNWLVLASLNTLNEANSPESWHHPRHTNV